MGPPQGGMSNPYVNPGNFGPSNGARTPFAGRTPNPYADGSKTPAWNASSRTPNPYGEGSKTPAWSVLSKTPNPYADGGKTPGWGSKTPNPYASGSGTGTSWGGTSPGRNAAWGDTSPARPSGAEWGSDDWSAPPRSFDSTWVSRSISTDKQMNFDFDLAQSVQTPAAVATPGDLAQTPAYMATTPAPMSEKTPQGVWSAATTAATPGDMVPAFHRSGDEDGQYLSVCWSAFALTSFL